MHRSVLIEEVMELLAVTPGGSYIDGTLGNAGHSLRILREAGPEGRLLGIDRDQEALGRARERLADCEGTLHLTHGDFADMADIARKAGIEQVDGVLLDIGVSSDQLDEPSRGFSLMHDGPLDMRMDPTAGQTAADLVNNLSEQDLQGIFREYGEERHARRIAGAIVRSRADSPITGTAQFAEIVEHAAGGRRGRIHPATRVFQALRIAVNDELGSLRRGLEAGLNLLVPGGRMGVISFHSLEDRIVKRFFVSHAGRWESLAAGGEEWVGEEPRVRLLNKKPITAGDAELSENPRSRSAKFRVVERIMPGIGRG
jgi:16S rRNA (cytosine1402-N4)-methyltransferase